jgi:hypothetical protein
MVLGNKSIMALVVFVCTACAGPRAGKNEYCEQFGAGKKNSSVIAEELYFFGSLQHGFSVVNIDCPRFVMGELVEDKYSRVDSVEKAERVANFHKKMLFTPSLKSGVYRVDGVFFIDKKRWGVQLVDVIKFEEVGDEEARKVMSVVFKEH